MDIFHGPLKSTLHSSSLLYALGCWPLWTKSSGSLDLSFPAGERTRLGYFSPGSLVAADGLCPSTGGPNTSGTFSSPLISLGSITAPTLVSLRPRNVTALHFAWPGMLRFLCGLSQLCPHLLNSAFIKFSSITQLGMPPVPYWISDW